MHEVEHGSLSEETEIIKDYQSRGFFRELAIEEIRHPEDEYLESFISRKQEMITLQVTQRCNLRCSYCVYSGDYHNREHTSKDMSFEVATKALDFAFTKSNASQRLSVSFYGGEPLIMFDLICNCVEYIEKQYSGRKYSFSITTNGTLLTKEIYSYLKEKDFNILVSIDGPKAIHDQNRKLRNGDGSFDRIISNLEDVESIDPESVNRIGISSVIGSNHDDSCNEQFFSIKEFNRFNSISVAFLSDLYIDEPHEYTEALIAAYTIEVCKLLLFLVGKISKTHVSKSLQSLAELYNREYRRIKRIEQFPKVVHPSGPCIPGAARLFVNIHGELFPCEKISELSQPMKLGTLDAGIDISKARKLLNPGKLITDHCKKCWMILHCTNCAAHYDTLTELSAARVLPRCESNQRQYEVMLKTLCFLKKHEYEFMPIKFY